MSPEVKKCLKIYTAIEEKTLAVVLLLNELTKAALS